MIFGKHMSAAITVLLAAIIQMGCATTTPLKVKLATPEDYKCAKHVEDLPGRKPLVLLEKVALLYESSCYEQVIELGRFIRKHHRDKEYSLSRETISVVAPEDSLSEYVLESYERAYLAYLMAASFKAMGKEEAASIELRKSYTEGKALLYTYGEDPINAILIATLWETLGDAELARPFWKKASESQDVSSTTKEFAQQRWEQLETQAPKKWHVLKLGEMPELDWSTNLRNAKAGYFDVHPKSAPKSVCRSETGVMEPTTAWTKKISMRYSSSYHPVLNAKSWVRLPIGVAYGLTTFTAGIAFSAGICYLSLSVSSGRSNCSEAFKLAAEAVALTPKVTNYVIAPDLRHWKKMPGTVMVTSAENLEDEKCWESVSYSSGQTAQGLVTELLSPTASASLDDLASPP